jgi:hypothetical protein
VPALNTLSPAHADGYWFSSALQFGNSFGAQFVLDLLVAGLALVVAGLVRHRKPVHGLNLWALCLVLGALGVIGISTLTRRAGATSPGYLQLTPFATLRKYVHDPADLLIYLAGNVALFIPLGFFLYLAARRWMLLCTGVTVLVSVGVEILQLPIYSRSSDIDDVITNGLGGLIGVVLAYLGLAFLKLLGLGMPRVVPDEPRLGEPEQRHQPDARQATGYRRPAFAREIGRGSHHQVPQPWSPRDDHHENAL